MKSKLAIVSLVTAAAFAPLALHAADSDTDRNKPATFVKDSAITTKIKSKLAAEHPSTLAHIKVDTDKNGIVWLSGTASSQQEVDQAVAVAKGTEGVKSVNNELMVQKNQ